CLAHPYCRPRPTRCDPSRSVFRGCSRCAACRRPAHRIRPAATIKRDIERDIGRDRCLSRAPQHNQLDPYVADRPRSSRMIVRGGPRIGASDPEGQVVGSYENIDAAVADFLFRAKPNLSRSGVAQVAALYCGGNGLAVRVVLVPPSLSSSLRTRSQQWGSVGALEAVIPNEDVTSFVAEIANGRLEGARFRGVLEQDVCFPKLNAWKYDYLGTPARAPDRGFKSIVIRL